MKIALRHDIDYVFGLRKGLPKMISIEESFNVKSTLFIRADLLTKSSDVEYLRGLEKRGWEIGLHLANTIDIKAARQELKHLQSLGFSIKGVTPCGKRGSPGFKGDITWSVMDSLGLEYMLVRSSLKPQFKAKTKIFPHPQLPSIDNFYIRNFGERRGFEKLVTDIDEVLKNKGGVCLLSHPEYFYASVGVLLPKSIRRINRLVIKPVFTVLRKRLLTKTYINLLEKYGKICCPLIDCINASRPQQET